MWDVNASLGDTTFQGEEEEEEAKEEEEKEEKEEEERGERRGIRMVEKKIKLQLTPAPTAPPITKILF